jgi:hypothetical protein
MMVTIEIDDTVLRAVKHATNIHDPSKLVNHLLEREIRVRAAQRRLAAAGGTMPDLDVPPRQRSLESA